MRLASFYADGAERWGIVFTSPVDEADWVLEPERIENTLTTMTSVRTSGYSARTSSFDTREWPMTLADFLAEGDEGVRQLHSLRRFATRFLAQSDQTLLSRSGYAVKDVELLAPIPRPRLAWGLVTNSPSFVRNSPGTPLVNLFPLAHQRPQGSIIGAGRNVVMKNGHGSPWFAYNVELGIVIGEGGRYIPIERAMDHVAGYTTVNDISGSHYFRAANGDAEPSYRLPDEYGDWFAQATASWAGKMADSMCPVGPYLVTKDEVGDPYDLLVYTRQSGLLRDRSHTAGTLLGIERVIAWYSSFATLHPGDIIHFGTMGVDGLPVSPESRVRDDETLEVEIEKVGTLSNPVVFPAEAPDPSEHSSYAVRSLALAGGGPLVDLSAWNASSARHFYTSFGNHRDADGMRVVSQPRFFNGPASSLGDALPKPGAQALELPPRTTDVTVAVELCFVIGRLANDVRAEDAFDYIAGFAPMLALTDHSLQADVAEPARPGERNIPRVYGRWADEFNTVGQLCPLGPTAWHDLRMMIERVDETSEASTSDYATGPAEMLSAISNMITLFPGDVITLGSTSAALRIPSGEVDGEAIVARVDRLGTVGRTLTRH